jgi:hypothetical protein
MRERDQERSDRLRSYRRSFSSEVRTNRGGRDPSRVPQRGGNGDDWIDVSLRRRKALRQGDRGQDRQRENKRRRDWDDGDNGQSRFRDSREEPRDYEDRFYFSDRYLDRKGAASMEQCRRRDVNLWKEEVRRGSVGNQKVLRRAAICVRKIDTNKQVQTTNIAAVNSSQPLVTVPSDSVTVSGSNIKRFVTFYFTNFPAQLSNFYLRKGFEVCDMLEEVVVPRKRNVYGEVYGFVRYSNVKDVTKLLKAVNAVCFGSFRVNAKVPRFDRTAVQLLEREEVFKEDTDDRKGKKGIVEEVTISGGCGVPSGSGGGKVLEMVALEGEGVEGPAIVKVGDVRVSLE